MMQGLTTTEAELLLKQYGQNIIDERKKKSLFFVYLEQFNNFLTILLLVAALLSFLGGELIDTILIFAIVMLNAAFGVYQELKASQAIAALKKLTVTKTRVKRDGREIEIDSRYLVPGDVIFIDEGVKVPADATVIESFNLETNESVLTGESLSVPKNTDDDLFMGTIVTRGRGLALITKTGMQSQFGKIAGELSDVEETVSPLQIKLDGLTKRVGILGVAIAVIVFFLTSFQETGLYPAFLLATSLAVALVPEGLPAVMTITLSLGVNEMAKRKAIVRKLSAIEALGSTTLIATDKTGTLTTNKMRVAEIYVDEHHHSADKIENVSSLALERLLLNGIMCSTASLVYVHDHGSYDMLGDPTEGALLLLAIQHRMDPDTVRKEWQLIQEIPFSTTSKRMTVKIKRGEEYFTFTKGAPEAILEIVDRIAIDGKEEVITTAHKEKISQTLENWASKGLRVLAFSSKNSHVDHHSGQVLLGMVAIHDAPRPEIKDAVQRAHDAGITVVMITGDNEKTAEAIGKFAGILKEGDEIVTGKQLDTYSDEELSKILPRVRIFARTSPLHKHRIVKLYQQMGEIVTVTGDGVNDAIALKQADVGVAMGLVGTDVARETADMVITDDNFATIVNAIEEGRNIIRNLKTSIAYLLRSNVTEGMSILTGIALGIPNLFHAIQILYINLISDGVPALSMAFSSHEEHIMKRPPQRDLKLISTREAKLIGFYAVISTSIVIAAYLAMRDNGDNIARTAAFCLLVLLEANIYVDAWTGKRSWIKNYKNLFKPIFLVAYLMSPVTLYLIISQPFAANTFKLTAMPFTTYLMLVSGSFVIFPIMYIVKKIVR